MDYKGATNLEIHTLLHPSAAFKHPRDVADPDLSLSERRAIPASWASDAAVGASPAPRAIGNVTVSNDEIVVTL
jgi:hypothetical protein